MRYFAIALLSSVLSFAGAYAHVTGTYDVHGNNDANTAPYTATLVVTESDDVYTATWTYSDNSQESGTGVRKGDDIAFVFVEVPDNGSNGVQLYEIHHDKLNGPWAIVSGSTVTTGWEVAVKQQHSSGCN